MQNPPRRRPEPETKNTRSLVVAQKLAAETDATNEFFNNLSHKQKWTGGEYFALDSTILGLYSGRAWS